MSFLDARRARVAKAWALKDEIVLVPAGSPIGIPGTDQFFPFRAHPDHRYLADMNEPECVLAFDARDGSWTLFAPRVPTDEVVWHGAVEETGRPLAELDAFVKGRTVRTLTEDEELTAAVVDARLRKDDEELARMRRAAAATAAGFEAARRAAVPGATERDVRTELEYAFLKAGADRPAFDTIVAAGRNAAALHHSPGDARIEEGQFVLVDAGASVGGYACDCTRTFVAGGEPAPDARGIHAIVKVAQGEAVNCCQVDMEYRDVHDAALIEIADGLVEMGLLRGKFRDLVESGAVSLFCPHGVGHLIGLCTHDPGGYAPGRKRSDHPAERWLRANRPLEADMTVTAEPGVYFIEALLRDPEARKRHGDAVDWARAESLLPLGGVRIEDTVLVDRVGPEVLTDAIPGGAVDDVY